MEFLNNLSCFDNVSSYGKKIINKSIFLNEDIYNFSQYLEYAGVSVFVEPKNKQNKCYFCQHTFDELDDICGQGYGH